VLFRLRLCDSRAPRAIAGLTLCALLLAGCVGEGDTGLGLDLVSQEQVQQMGAETWQRIRSDTPASSNRQYQRTAERVASDLLQAAGANPGEWEVVVFEGEQANAFALPGGRIGIYEGMFQIAENEAQLAAVIAHEIGHVRAEHSQERVNSQVATQGAVQLVSAALQIGNVGYANAIAGALGAGAQYGVLLPYSRNQELEADRTGLRLMVEAGHDPREALEFWRRMEQQAGGQPPAFLSTHPAAGERIERLEELMPAAVEAYQGNG
jgi:predicted Zn-dependent protease